MAHLEINGVPYPIPDTFTYAEMKVFKRVAGVRGAEIGDALEAGDTDVIIALSVICLGRAGIKADEDKLMALEIGAIKAVDDQDDEGDETGPPAIPLRPGPPGGAEATIATGSSMTIQQGSPAASGGQS